MTSASRVSAHPSTHDSGFGFLLPADLTYHHCPPTHPRTASPITYRKAAGLCTGWLAASRCHRKETV